MKRLSTDMRRRIVGSALPIHKAAGLLAVLLFLGAALPSWSLDHWGFIDKSGKLVIPAQYQFASSFSKPTSWFGLLDAPTAEVWQFDPRNPFSFEDAMAVRIDALGKELSELEAAKLDARRAGLAPFKQNGKFGYVNGSGDMVIKPQFVSATAFEHGMALVQIEKEVPFYVIDAAGKKIEALPPGWEPLPPWSDGIMMCMAPSSVDHGFINKSGKFVVPKTHCVIREFHDGLAEFSAFDKQLSSHSGFIDDQARVVIPAQFDFVFGFTDGLATVYNKGHWSYIDKSGKTVITLPAECSDAEPFHEGLAAVAFGGVPFKSQYLQPNEGAKWGFIDTKGKVVIPGQFPTVDWPMHLSFSEGLASVPIGTKENYKYGFIDRTGKIVIPAQFKQAFDFSAGLAAVKVGATQFDPTEWKAMSSCHAAVWSRTDMAELFFRQHHPIGMDRQALHKLLGPGGTGAYDCYTVVGSWCGNGCQWLQFDYQNNKVARYRFCSLDHPGAWISK